jgi:hypothetical protein
MNNYLLILALLFQSMLGAGTLIHDKFKGPTEQLVKRESWEIIEKKLTQMQIPTKLYSYFNNISRQENWGHIGYHGANQEYRIYQDIIRFIVEEVLDIPIPKHFHFLRIPGDSDLNLNSIQEFNEFWGKMDNRDHVRAKQLLSLNYGIYSNYDVRGSCSLNLFVKDKGREISFSEQLIPFFHALGLPLNAIEKLFNIAGRKLKSKGGILLQLFDNSHLSKLSTEAYNFADEQCYPSIRGGYRYDYENLSTHFERIMSDLYIDHKLDISPQLRLLINNRYTLNPFSHLEIQRWDFYDDTTISSYEAEMRNSIRLLNYNALKAQKYKQKLLEIWNLKFTQKND